MFNRSKYDTNTPEAIKELEILSATDSGELKEFVVIGRVGEDVLDENGNYIDSESYYKEYDLTEKELIKLLREFPIDDFIITRIDEIEYEVER